jgi:superfamily II DNA/RNA helicase
MFQNGKVEALIATDVAARGIHVDDVACVVHFDPPADVKDYLHRSGRTARAGASGAVVSFIGRQQVGVARRMQRDLGLRDHMPSPELDALGDGGGEVIGEVKTISSGGGQHRSQGGGGERRNSSRAGGGGRSSSGRNGSSRSRYGGGTGGGSGSGARRTGSGARRSSGKPSRGR